MSSRTDVKVLVMAISRELDDNIDDFHSKQLRSSFYRFIRGIHIEAENVEVNMISSLVTSMYSAASCTHVQYIIHVLMDIVE